MRFGFYAPSLSFHQIPFFEALKRVWPDKCVYYYRDQTHGAEKASFGWDAAQTEGSVFVGEGTGSDVETVDVLMLSVRNLDLIQRRLEKGLITIYGAERWFKPIRLFGNPWFVISGIVRLFFPPYFRMARRFVRFFEHDGFYCFPHGIFAVKDMARMVGLFHGDLRCLFRAPHLEIDRVPCGCIKSRNPGFYGTNRMRLWGYFVAPSTVGRQTEYDSLKANKLLYVGRLIKLKRVDTLIKAMRLLKGFTLTILGSGAESPRLKRLASDLPISFIEFVKISEVRTIMRQHGTLIFSSTGEDGWGAVVSEALEEGMNVVGTYETGASATILPESNLFHSGDFRELAKVILRRTKPLVQFEWGAESAARRLTKEFIKSK